MSAVSHLFRRLIVVVDRLCWYVADNWVRQLQDRTTYRPRPAGQDQPAEDPIPTRVLVGLGALSNFLVKETAMLEDSSTDPKKRKSIYDRIPKEVVTNASSLARDLQWRTKQMLQGRPDVNSDFLDEEGVAQTVDVDGKNGKKRKESSGDGRPNGQKRPRVRNPPTR